MKSYSLPISNEALRGLCIKNEWFNSGSNTQYEKLFDLNETGASIDTLATVIWTCSDGVELEDIQRTLAEQAAWPIDITYLETCLIQCGWGQTERDIILSAVESHPGAGVCYRITREE